MEALHRGVDLGIRGRGHRVDPRLGHGALERLALGEAGEIDPAGVLAPALAVEAVERHRPRQRRCIRRMQR